LGTTRAMLRALGEAAQSLGKIWEIQ
jgi:hypothetical protein